MVDHMSGINALVPRWDPENLAKGYNYDPRNYDRQDYERFKNARREADQKRQKQAERELKNAMRESVMYCHG